MKTFIMRNHVRFFSKTAALNVLGICQENILPKAGNYMFKVDNRNNRNRCDICSKLKIRTSLWRRFRKMLF